MREAKEILARLGGPGEKEGGLSPEEFEAHVGRIYRRESDPYAEAELILAKLK